MFLYRFMSIYVCIVYGIWSLDLLYCYSLLVILLFCLLYVFVIIILFHIQMNKVTNEEERVI